MMESQVSFWRVRDGRRHRRTAERARHPMCAYGHAFIGLLPGRSGAIVRAEHYVPVGTVPSESQAGD